MTTATQPLFQPRLSPGTPALDSVEWGTDDVVLTDAKGKETFRQNAVRYPKAWTKNALRVVVTRYFRGTVGAPDRDSGVDEIVQRVTNWYGGKYLEAGLGDEEQAVAFGNELAAAVYQQLATWNSPVWFNVGIYERPVCMACFILDVADYMLGEDGEERPNSILRNAVTEGTIFSAGSGVGTDLSQLRSSKELIRGGGKASGPISFARGYGSNAAVIKSGGRTRRAAIMRTLMDWHLDLHHGDGKTGLDFLSAKAFEEDLLRALIREGLAKPQMDDLPFLLMPFQSANLSVRATDAFMQAVRDDLDWTLHGTKQQDITKTFKAREIFAAICHYTWECGDPGMQFHDTINRWHTCPNDGVQVSSNPCSEYLWLNNTACNLASLNLLRFLRPDGTFDIELFIYVVSMFTTSLDLNVSYSGLPTREIEEGTLKYRNLGLGYANLGSLLMCLGFAYDSQAGRDLAAAITSLMSAQAYLTSARLAQQLGPFPRFEANRDEMLRVIDMHRHEARDLAKRVVERGNSDVAQQIAKQAASIWDKAHAHGTEHGFRNAQVSLLAPTGTIAYMMDCDTTGVEPAAALRTYKQLSGGGVLEQTMPHVETGLRALGYADTEIESALAHVDANGVLHDWGGFHKPEHAKVFEAAIPAYGPAISPEGHLRMLGAVQPFLSGGISKTVNCPAETTEEEIAKLYMLAWELGVKCVAIYRDTSKAIQAISGSATADNLQHLLSKPTKILELPSELKAIRKRIQVGEVRGYVTVSFVETPKGDRPLETFVTLARQGDALNGAYSMIGILISTLLQANVPLEDVIKRMKDQSFKPAGYTAEHGKGFCPMAKSVVDFIGRWLEERFLPHHAEDTRRFNAGLVAEAMKNSGADSNGNGHGNVNVNVSLGYVSIANCPNCATPMKYLGGTCHECPSCFYKEGGCGG